MLSWFLYRNPSWRVAFRTLHPRRECRQAPQLWRSSRSQLPVSVPWLAESRLSTVINATPISSIPAASSQTLRGIAWRFLRLLVLRVRATVHPFSNHQKGPNPSADAVQAAHRFTRPNDQSTDARLLSSPISGSSSADQAAARRDSVVRPAHLAANW